MHGWCNRTGPCAGRVVARGESWKYAQLSWPLHRLRELRETGGTRGMVSHARGEKCCQGCCIAMSREGPENKKSTCISIMTHGRQRCRTLDCVEVKTTLSMRTTFLLLHGRHMSGGWFSARPLIRRRRRTTNNNLTTI